MVGHFSFSIFVNVVLLHFAIASMILTASYAKTIPGSISIDCGSSRKSYFDNVTTLTWENDEKYTSRGKDAEANTSVLAEYTDYSFPNLNALRTFRYFPEKHKKHCYVLPTPIKNVSVLIRAMFYPGNFGLPLSDKLKLPIDFEVAVNSTIWFSVRYDQRQENPYPKVFEGIFYSPGGHINVCLLPKSGIPFISSLELRPLDEQGLMYSFEDSKKKYLVSKIRVNFSNVTTNTVRFPDDNIDRLWDALGDPAYINSFGLFGSDCYMNQNTSFVPTGGEGLSGSDTVLGAKLNNVPSRVMQDAVQFSPDSTIPSLDVYFYEYYSSSSEQGNSLVNSAYVILYFRDLQSTSPPSKVLNMKVNFSTYEESNFSVSNNATMQTFQDLILESESVSMFLTTPMDPTAFPFINAMEIYEEQFVNPTATYSLDELGIKLLLEIFNITEMGDPCSPVPFDWLQCDDVGDGLEVTSVSLHMGPGSHGTLSSNLPQINSTAGALLPDLYNMTVTGANIEDKVFHFIVRVLVGYYLPPTKFDFSHNNIETFPTAGALNLSFPYTIYLNEFSMSHNALTEIPSFIMDFDSEYYSYVTYLNLSYNKLRSLPNSWRNATNLSIEVLDFSNNDISGNMSLLDKLIRGNNASLRKLDVSHNKLQGPFSSSVYFSNLDSLVVAKFDGNQIDGTLNLAIWYKRLEEAEKMIKNNYKPFNLTSALPQLAVFSFIDNNISDISPDAEIIYSRIKLLSDKGNSSLFSKSIGILLNGNPYCKDAKGYAQKYLCRKFLSDNVPDSKKFSKMTICFISLGGVAAFCICCAVVVIILRLKKKILGLQKIHQALADQKVIPLFYSLSEIKAATRRFHDDNLLGRGAYGVVYKGILADKSTIAVKKLFKSEADQIQVLNDFINEVVLVSGIRHKYLVHLKGCCIENQERILIYEYVEHGNVAEALWGSQVNGILDWKARLKICIGVAQGLLYLHEHLEPRIIHRDIKPANILLDKDFNPKIADFGLARSFPDDASQARTAHHGGTWGYLAPDHEITEKVDVYSFGIVVLEIVSGRKIIESDNFPQEERYLRTWAQRMYKEGTLMKLLPQELRQHWSEIEFEVIRIINVALLCVDLEPYKRPAMSQVVTMLVGSTDAPAPCTVDGFSNIDFGSLYDTDLSRTMPTFKTLKSKLPKLKSTLKVRVDVDNENSEERSLLGRSHSGSNSTNTNNIVEMSDLSGR